MSSTTTGKRAYAEALKDAQDFRAMFPSECYDRWEIAGSVRRRKPEIADIEHVIIPRHGDVAVGGGLFAQVQAVNLLWHHLETLVAGQEVRKHIYGTTGFRWGDKYRGVDWRGFNHELFTADESNWGCIFAIRTGPADFSQQAVTRMKYGGLYRQIDGYVVHVSSGERVPVPDEHSFFSLAGMRYVEPSRRI